MKESRRKQTNKNSYSGREDWDEAKMAGMLFYAPPFPV